MADAELIQGEVHERPQGSGELLRLHWVSLRDAEALELPGITRVVLAEVERRLREGMLPKIPDPLYTFATASRW